MGSSSSSSSDYYRQQDEANQAAIREGTAAIDRIFDGGTYGVNQVDPSNLVAGTTYYLADGSEYVYPGAAESTSSPQTIFGRDKDDNDNWADRFSWDSTEESSLPDLYAAAETTTGFDDAFYDRQQQAYLDYAMPQLEQQRGDASKELTYSLARAGQLEGSSAASQASELQRLYDIEAQNVADQALDYSNQSRTAVEDARSDLISTLNLTGDADAAASSAISRASTLSQPTAYSPLADLFGSYTSALGTAAAAERAYALGWGSSSSSSTPTWYGGNSGSVSVT